SRQARMRLAAVADSTHQQTSAAEAGAELDAQARHAEQAQLTEQAEQATAAADAAAEPSAEYVAEFEAEA
ncbi:MAG: hypothetical protein J2P17_27985, partial [Mycobacterium sp.]|nr:hypothetical protein [Mycobacterium sp.]